jgi:hypothetical protein
MTEESKSIPEEFTRVIKDFVGDIRTTFPEYTSFIDKWWKSKEHFSYIDEEEERNKAIETSEKNSVKFLFEYCQKKFPPRFFDILYQNNEMFKEDSEIDTEFLPKIHFKNLWQCEISEKTKDTIWKYLQLIMFSIVGTLDNKDAFGDTAKMFESINQEEFKSKLEDTLSQMQGLFNIPSGENMSEPSEGLGAGINMPDADQLHEHITGMLDGKLGQLAREIAEETAANLNMDFDGATDMKDIFQNLVKNPTKLMGLVKTVGDKLDSKIKSGDLKETELIAEATEMMNKMKNMPGMGNIQSMLSKMGMGGMAGMGGKVNTAAMEANLNQKMKMAKTKERIRAKAEANAKAKVEAQLASQLLAQQAQQQPKMSDEEIIKFINSGEKVERTPRGAKPPQNNNDNNNNNNNNKKKKGKK